MFHHETQVRVRYGETDPMGYVYYGNYALYYEVGRVEMLRALGLTYSDMEAVHRIMLPVMSVQMRFVRAAHYDELLTVKTTLRKMPTDTMTFHVEVFNERGKLCNGGSVKLCFVDMASKKTIAAPTYLTDKLEPFFDTV
jgi:acyl-CoA thioester hydrolase